MVFNPLTGTENDCGDGGVQTCATSSQILLSNAFGQDSSISGETIAIATLAGFDDGQSGGNSLCDLLDSLAQTLPIWQTSPTVTTSTRQVQCFICNDAINTNRSASTAEHVSEINAQCRPALCDPSAVQKTVSFYSGGEVVSSQEPQAAGAIPTEVVQNRNMCGPMPVVPAGRVGVFVASPSITSEDPRYDG